MSQVPARGEVCELELGDGTVVAFALTRPTAALDQAMAKLECSQAAIVTAYNPKSYALCEAENRAAHDMLRADIVSRGHDWIAARSLSSDGAVVQPAFLLPGMSCRDALMLAERAGQETFIYVAVGKPPVRMIVPDPVKPDGA